MSKEKHWIYNADSYICPVCRFECHSPSDYEGGKCPKCGFQEEKQIDSTDWLIRGIPKEQLEREKQASYYICRILTEADILNQRLGILNPTVFISRDILEIIKSGMSYYVMPYSRSDRITICGYDCKMAFGENVLYVGYDILNGGRQ